MEKSIVEKLNLTKYQRKAIVHRPNKNYFADLKDLHKGFPNEPVDLLIIFVQTMMEFKENVMKVIEMNLINKEGVLLIAYPKKGNSTYPTYVHRDEIFPALQVNDEDGYVKNSTLKFNRMVRLDQTFTVVGMKNTVSTSKKNQVSGRVEDYLQFIPEIEKIIHLHPEVKELFDNLTPGYKKEWARYIYSGKQETTREKRKAEMLAILAKGFKTKELYRQSLKNNGGNEDG